MKEAIRLKYILYNLYNNLNARMIIIIILKINL